MDVAVAQGMAIPNEKAAVIIQFNRISGAVGFIILDDGIDIDTLGNQDLFRYVRDEMNMSDDVIVGNYPDYEIKARDSLPTRITEEFEDMAAAAKITKRYPVASQANVLGRAILKLSEAAGIEQEELLEMMDYINEVKRANAVRKEFYKSSPDYEYISKEDAEAEEAARLEGGVHELYGPRENVGGRVFS